MAVADVGGAYLNRLLAMGGVVLLGGASWLLAWALGGSLWTAGLLMAAAGVAFSLLRVLGKVGSTVGALVIVMVAVALGQPIPTLADGAAALANFVAGGLAMMGVSLAFWPTTPYRPARAAVARCYETLSTILERLSRLLGEPSPQGDWDALIRQAHRTLRLAIEEARATLMATRIGRPAASAQGELLQVLVELADRAFVATIGLTELLETLPPGAPVAAPLRPVLDGLARDFAQNGDAVWHGRVRFDGKSDERLEALRRAFPADAPPEYGYIVERCERLDREARLAREALSAAPGDLAASDQRAPTVDWGGLVRSRMAQLRDTLSLRSRAMRHALRVGITAAIAVLATRWLRLDHGAWVTLTTVLILQPSLGETWTRGVQRVLGSVVGGAIAALLVTLSHQSLAIPLMIAVSAFAAMALRPVNYTYFTAFVTPAFVLLAQLAGGDWHLALMRVAASVAGGLLAIASLYLIWPERASARHELVAALEADQAYFRITFWRALGGDPPSARALPEARRRIGLANNNAEDAVQRLLNEGRLDEQQRSAAFTLTLLARRFAAAVITLVPVHEAWEAPEMAPQVARFAREVDGSLTAVIETLKSERTAAVPPQLANSEPETGKASDRTPPGWLVNQFLRLSEQVSVMEDAASRLEQV